MKLQIQPCTLSSSRRVTIRTVEVIEEQREIRCQKRGNFQAVAVHIDVMD